MSLKLGGLPPRNGGLFTATRPDPTPIAGRTAGPAGSSPSLRSPWLGRRAIIALLPPRDTYIETHLGGGAIMHRKTPGGG